MTAFLAKTRDGFCFVRRGTQQKKNVLKREERSAFNGSRLERSKFNVFKASGAVQIPDVRQPFG
jgi:hypothetical protein